MGALRMAKALAKNLHPFSNLIQSPRVETNREIFLKNPRAVIFQGLRLLILACFVGVGLNGFRKRIDTPKIDGTGPNCSTDALLKESLGVSGASEKITAELGKLPETMHPIVVFWPKINGNAVISYQITSYLSWPRETFSVPMDTQLIGKAVGDFKKEPFSAMVFYILKPPAPEPDSTAIGQMTIVRLEQRQP